MRRGVVITLATIISVAVLILEAACSPQVQPSPDATKAAPEASPKATVTIPAPTEASAAPTTAAQGEPSYKDIPYEIEGTPVPLTNGVAEEEAAPGSASKIITRFFGNEATGDLNGDGRPDVVFLLTREPGGSGTFFYVVAALRNDAGYQGTNAILLGDRIAPQPITIENGRIIVNYADRKPDEPMTAKPSVGVSRFFKVLEGKLVADEAVSQITNRKWVWEQTQMNDGTVTTPKQPDAFTITFRDNGIVEGTTDCNSFSGTYKTVGPKIEFGPFASTMMACEGSQEAEFMKSLGEVDQFLYVEGEDKLALLIKYDSGSMVFK